MINIQDAVRELAAEGTSEKIALSDILEGNISKYDKYQTAKINHELVKFFVGLEDLEIHNPMFVNIWTYLKQLHYIDMFNVLGAIVMIGIQNKNDANSMLLLREDIDTCKIIVDTLNKKGQHREIDPSEVVTEQEAMKRAAGDMYCHDRNPYLIAF